VSIFDVNKCNLIIAFHAVIFVIPICFIHAQANYKTWGLSSF
jgi:hypothetical protein